MKIRTDFVTNSSSSNFIVARRPTANQKKIMIEFAEEKLLGDVILQPDTSIEDVRKALEEVGLEEYENEVVKRLKQGFEVGIGSIDHELVDVADYYEDLWDRFENEDSKNFIRIRGDLSY